MGKLKKISSTSHRNQFDYMSTAILYCWATWIPRVRVNIQMSAFHLIRLFVLLFLPKKSLIRFYRNHIETMKAQEQFFGDKEIGHDIATAKYMVYNTFTGYLGFPLFVIAGLISSLIGWDVVASWIGGPNRRVMPLAIAVLTFFGLIILSKAIDNPKIYLSYFKEFEKQDEGWLKKWKRYTILLFIGSLLSLASGIILYFWMS